MLNFGGRYSACWNNSTEDFGLQASNVPARVWAERHLLPLDSAAQIIPSRGRYCLDDSCISLEDANGLGVTDVSFDYSSTGFALRRPVPCRPGTYCHPGTAMKESTLHLFTTPQLCFESRYCPEGSAKPNGIGGCPKGFYCRLGTKNQCPVGSYCPYSGTFDPIPCEPGKREGLVLVFILMLMFLA